MPELIKELKINKSEFAKMIKSTPQQIGNYILKDVEIKNKFANKIIKAYPNVNIDFIMYGQKPIFKEFPEFSIKNKDDTDKLIEILKKENEVLREKVSYYEHREISGAIRETHSAIHIINSDKKKQNDKG